MSGSVTINPANKQIGVANAQIPPGGPLVVPLSLPFNTALACSVDLTLAYMNASMQIVQSLWIDNFTNAASITVTVSGTGQTIEIPAYSQGSFPVIAAKSPVLSFAATSNTAQPVNCLVLNVPMPLQVWYKQSTVVVASGAVSVTGNVAVTASPSVTLATAPATFAITNAGTAVTVFAANGARHGAAIQNNNASPLFVDFINTAGTVAPGTHGTTFELTTGQTLNIPSVSNAITANGTVAGQALSAAQW